MKRLFLSLLVFLSIGAMALAACSVESIEETPEVFATPVTPPSDYAALKNPYATSDAVAVDAGQTLYKTNCTSCHGEVGKGDGPATSALIPKPANLADHMGAFSDGYLYWRISAGGQMPPFNSAMPAWKDIFTEEQIWQIITYMRTFGS